MENNLEVLSQRLFEVVAEGFPASKRDLLRAKWPQIRDVAAQNGGYKGWGKHLLGPNRLEEVFRKTVYCVEEKGLDLAHFVKTDLHFLLDPAVRWKDLPLNKRAAKALLLEYDPQFVADYRRQFQTIFETLSAMEVWHTREPLVTQMLMGGLIALLPLFDFEEGALLPLLQLIEGKWKTVEYRVVHLPLVPGKINAYGLESEGAVPILVFRSTPYPAATGFLEAILSDLHPTRSIGEDIFKSGKKVLDAWMQGKQKVRCYGMSLGGALAYHAGQAYGDVVEVHAYVAPGINRSMGQIRGCGFFHHKDLVNLVGLHPESEQFEMFSIVTESDVNFVQAHAMPPGIEPTVVLRINPRYENQTVGRRVVRWMRGVVTAPIWGALVVIEWGLKSWNRR